MHVILHEKNVTGAEQLCPPACCLPCLHVVPEEREQRAEVPVEAMEEALAEVWGSHTRWGRAGRWRGHILHRTRGPSTQQTR